MVVDHWSFNVIYLFAYQSCRSIAKVCLQFANLFARHSTGKIKGRWICLHMNRKIAIGIWSSPSKSQLHLFAFTYLKLANCVHRERLTQSLFQVTHSVRPPMVASSSSKAHLYSYLTKKLPTNHLLMNNNDDQLLHWLLVYIATVATYTTHCSSWIIYQRVLQLLNSTRKSIAPSFIHSLHIYLSDKEADTLWGQFSQLFVPQLNLCNIMWTCPRKALFMVLAQTLAIN